VSVTRVELKRKRYGVARKSAGSAARRIASEMALWRGVYVYEVSDVGRKEKRYIYQDNPLITYLRSANVLNANGTIMYRTPNI